MFISAKYLTFSVQFPQSSRFWRSLLFSNKSIKNSFISANMQQILNKCVTSYQSGQIIMICNMQTFQIGGMFSSHFTSYFHSNSQLRLCHCFYISSQSLSFQLYSDSDSVYVFVGKLKKNVKDYIHYINVYYYLYYILFTIEYGPAYIKTKIGSK